MNEVGSVIELKKNVTILKGNETTIEFPELLTEIRGSKFRQFVIIVNNRGQNLLADSEAFSLNKKPILTSFNQIIEIYPVKREINN